MKNKSTKGRLFQDASIGQNFMIFFNNKPLSLRKTNHTTAIGRDNKIHIIYPNELCASLGRVVGGIPMINVNGNPTVVLLCSENYWKEMPFKEAEIEAVKLGLCTVSTPVFIVRGNK